ncbi:redox-sensing transcriptional repressor Rex [Nakamurella aerolata]|uniref:Redox-sensing transcriptional repressor Rex n=1 Tax=Nakamurella aerolata TaxID=1656892 RepID=A0A849A1W5_9ACTN|nr:redox-sensing transcriptional repressor Rex [Nakamurella aerolata]NNG35024.1 redox-sensing transcriptional repressor Rex [Nakamurella aerolata]
MSLAADPSSPAQPPAAVPAATAARLPHYLRALSDFGATVNSQDLATAAGVDAATLRRDLSRLGSYGIRGVGYDTAVLSAEISRALGAELDHRVALFGLGNLGRALAGYAGFAGRGFALVALFDVDPTVIGAALPTAAGPLQVHHTRDAATVIAAERVTIGMIAAPDGDAQSIADLLISAGIKSVLSFTSGRLDVPADVHVRQIDVGLEMQMLAFHQAHLLTPADPAEPTPQQQQRRSG